MWAKEMLEKLHDLATYFTLAASDAGRQQKKEARIGTAQNNRLAAFYEGRKAAFNTAFKKVDAIIKEAKR